MTTGETMTRTAPLPRRLAPAAALGLAALVSLGTIPAAKAEGFDLQSMTPEQRDAFGEAVRAYLLDNPQVIMEAVAVLEQRESEQQAAADVSLVQTNADALFEDGFSWVGGNPDGDVTVVEFIDYRCGYCRRAHPEVEELIGSDGNIRFIVKEFPILGEASMTSSRFAIATHLVAGDTAYKAVHDALVALEGNPTEPALRRIAETLGYDADAILARMGDEEVTRRIAETRALAQRMQINGTPSFVMGETMLRGYVPLDGMRRIIADERKGG
jgi:protein-disulfide isomerase